MVEVELVSHISLRRPAVSILLLKVSNAVALRAREDRNLADL